MNPRTYSHPISNMNYGYNNSFNNNGYGYNMNANSNPMNYQNNNNFNNNGMTSYNTNSNNYNGYSNNQNNYYQQNSYNNGNYNNQNNNNQQYNFGNYNNNNFNNMNAYNQQMNNVNYNINNNQNQNNNNFNGQNFFNNSNRNNFQQMTSQNYFYNNNNSNNNNYNLFNQQHKNKNNQFQTNTRNQAFISNQRNQNNNNNLYPKQNIDINQDSNEQNQGKIFNNIYKGRKVNNINSNLPNQNNKNKIYNNIKLNNNQNKPVQIKANNNNNQDFKQKKNNNANKSNIDTNNNNNQNLNQNKNNAPNKNNIKSDNKALFDSKTMVKPRALNKIPLDFLTRATGLDNVGATCYMNATLQCLYHVKALSENIINDDKINDKLKLTFCFKNLIEELAGCKERKKYLLRRQYFLDDKYLKDSVRPIKFKELISDMNPIFKGVQANDSKDLILFLLETMDKELTLRNNKTKETENFYGSNEDELKPENFKKCHNSIFADIFYGFQKSVVKCDRCKTENPTYNVMNFLIFHLEKTYNDLNQQKNKNNNNNMNNMNTQYNMNNQNNMNNQYYMNNQYNMYNMNNMNNMYNNMNRNMNNYSNNYNNFRNGINNRNQLNPQTQQPRRSNNMNINMINIQNEKKKLTLLDCFQNNRNAEHLTGSNQIYCNKCNDNTNAMMYDEIHKAPNVLIIILNRGKGNKFECDLEFEKTLNLTNYITNPASPKSYELIGVISHLGKSSLEGHFIAYCKHFDDSWYIFNDSIVNQIDDKKDFKGIPYILFYKNTEWSE